MKLPLIPTSITVLTASVTSAVILTSEKDLDLIEVYVYDKDSQEKKIRFSLLELDSTKYLEFYDEKEEDEDSRWKRTYLAETDEDKSLLAKLYSLSKNYIRTQHSLNLIKAQGKQDWDLSSLCSNGSATNCDASSCLCCYTTDKEEFKKVQRTFNFLIANMESSWTNQYLQPVQAHIKLIDLSFSELKVPISLTEKTTTEYRKFAGSLVYSFVDYYYKHKEYEDTIPEDKKEGLLNLEVNNKDIYFSNIPQQLSFKNTKLGLPEDNPQEIKEEEDNVEKIWEVIKNPKDLLEKSRKVSIEPVTETCCQNKEDKLDCLIKKNFMFLEKGSGENKGLNVVQKKVKNYSNSCCSTN